MALLENLLAERATAWKAVEDIRARLESDKASEDDDAAFTRALDDVDSLTGKIATAERERRMAAIDYTPAVAPRIEGRTDNGPAGDVEARDVQYAKAFTKYLARGAGDLESDERELLSSGYQERAAGTTSGPVGGYLIPPGFRTVLVQVMKAYGGVQTLAEELTTATGNSLQWPLNDDTGNPAVIVSENTDVGAGTDFVFSQLTLGAFTYANPPVRVSFQVLQDSAFDLDKFVPTAMGVRFGRGVANHLVNGTGTGQPTGILTGITTGKTGLVGQTTTVIYDDLVDTMHSIDPAYRSPVSFPMDGDENQSGLGANPQWLMNDKSLAVCRKIKDTQGHPLWQPSIVAGLPDTLLGYPVTIDQAMPNMAANAKSIIFGSLKDGYIVRLVNDLIAMRLVERYAEFGQVGFISFLRLDAKPTVAKAVAAYVNSAT